MKTQFYTASSLDGFIAAPGDDLAWLMQGEKGTRYLFPVVPPSIFPGGVPGFILRALSLGVSSVQSVKSVDSFFPQLPAEDPPVHGK